MFFLLLVCLSLVYALPLLKRDVWVPPVTYPTSGTVWVAGQTYNVTWNTSSEPSQVTNPNGQIYLRNGSFTQDSPIASGFPLSAGAVNVTIPPTTAPGNDWMVVLFGDSGDWSANFTIVAPSSPQ